MIDSHCHLDFDAYDNDRDRVVSDARAAGIDTIINIGVDIAASRRSIELAEKYDMVYATVGIHPHDAKTAENEAIDTLRDLAKHPKVVAIGEIGLDYYRNLSPHDVQQKAFHQQLELACDMNLPVVIHTRESFDDSLSIIRKYASRLPGGVFHCFPGSVDDAEKVFDIGFMISVGGVITFPKARMAEVAAEVPLDRLLLETDAPYLTPVPHRGKTNYPAYVSLVYKKVAELRDMPLAEIEKTVDRSCRKLFGLVETFGG